MRGAAPTSFLSAEDVPAAWDGWDVDADCMEKLRPDGVLQSRMVAADGPLEYRVRCTWTVCGGSVVRQDIIFHADSPLVEFDTELEWHGKHRLLKAAFDTSVQAPAARQEIQFGCIQRPTTRNDSLEQAKFEVCCHKYADLSEPSYGVALLNDCKYGVSVEGGRIALSLAKGGMRPDPRGDEGVYTFQCIFAPCRTPGLLRWEMCNPARLPSTPVRGAARLRRGPAFGAACPCRRGQCDARDRQALRGRRTRIHPAPV